MTDNPLVTAIDLHTNARAAFDRDELDQARSLAQSFEALGYSFVRRIEGPAFRWRRNAVCIVSDQDLAATRTLIGELAPLAADPDFCFVLVSDAADDLFLYARDLLGGAFLGLVTGASFGSAAARNAAARVAEADTIIFIDDDVLVTPSDVRALVETRDRYDATAVRGRIVAASDIHDQPRHYDLGSGVRQSAVDIDGLSLWTAAALRSAPFDILLSGDKGIDLTARLYPACGPDAFLYEPAAAMRRTFAAAVNPADTVHDLMERHERYLAGKPGVAAIRSVFETFGHADHASAALADRARLVARARDVATPAAQATILTICDRASGPIDDWCDALGDAIGTGATLALVASDETRTTAREIAEHLGGRGSVRVIDTEATLPAAMVRAALHDIDTTFAIVAGLGQASIRQRIGWTMASFDIDPEADMAGFLLFDAETGLRSSLPWPRWREDMAARCLFGAPCEFGALAFRVDRLRALAPATTDDFGWLYDGLLSGSLRGTLFPVGVSFQSRPGQRPAADMRFEADFRARAIARHRALIGDAFDAYDEEALDYVVGARPVPTDISVGRLRSYAARMIAELVRSGDPKAIDREAALIRLVSEADLRRLRTDVVRMQARMKKIEISATELTKAQDQLVYVQEKLEWNREQVADLKEKLATATLETEQLEAQKQELSRHGQRLDETEKRLGEAERRIRSLEREVRKPTLAKRILRRLRGS